MPVERKINFYKIYCGQDPNTGLYTAFPAARIMADIGALQNRYTDNPNLPLIGWPEHLANGNPRIALGKSRRTDMPFCDGNGNRMPLPIQPNHGVCEVTHFVFFPGNFVAEVYNHHGPRVGGLMAYLSEKVGDWYFQEYGAMMIACNLIKANPNNQIDLAQIEKVELSLKPGDQMIQNQLNQTQVFSALRNLVAGSGGVTVELVVKRKVTRRQPQGVNQDFVREAIGMLQQEGVNVQKLKVFGIPNRDAEDRAVDLLRQRIQTTAMIDKMDDGSNALQDVSAFQQAEAAFARMQPTLLQAMVLNGYI